MMNDYDDNDELGEITNYHLVFIPTTMRMTMMMMTEGDVGAIEDMWLVYDDSDLADNTDGDDRW